ncbi:MAG: hypothetical protein ACP5N1_01900 [Candidatus Woesearchaeota archaeon]
MGILSNLYLSHLEVVPTKGRVFGNILVQTNDWGLYLINKRAIACISEHHEKDFHYPVFSGAQNPSYDDVVDTLKWNGHLWVMKSDPTQVYPTEQLRDRAMHLAPNTYFEKIFDRHHIRKISYEPMSFFDWKEHQGIYIVKPPKKTLVGYLGAYLDNKFK